MRDELFHFQIYLIEMFKSPAMFSDSLENQLGVHQQN